MKKYISLFALVALFLSCNKDLVEKPDNLIDKKVMGDIYYDMSILEALKYQNPNSLYTNGINPKTYIFKKYKIDSLQFAKSNAYYAADYREYKKMYDALNDRLKKEKTAVDLIIKKEAKKEAALKKARAKKVQDSITKAKKIKDLKIKKEKDSIAQKKQEIKAKK
ncbi:uncharacterized protein DUF4296 [Flavobacterium sp. 103]|uniref:DUF4296 domain-containing protein n=1 Tax=unclassified Flavobacterium TaxID=196869 RepID=UPI000D5ECACF|nr:MULTISPECIES: DUF4296 domain-containing protein [unclassified Flavobacterium]PVX45523.1 uncharacterized protein DUF4296 [Flavobacterium sp. 103]QKJ62343.1 DUF4296 domain-containing protein [Flavobacterium sp. M31R6]